MAVRTAGAVGMCGLQFHDGAKVNIYLKNLTNNALNY